MKRHASAVRRSVAYLELLRRGRLGVWLLGYPVVAVAVALYPLLLLACLLLLWRRPVWLLKINEALSRYADVKLPLWLTGPTLPLRHAVLVGFFHHHPRMLDAWGDSGRRPSPRWCRLSAHSRTLTGAPAWTRRWRWGRRPRRVGRPRPYRP